MQKCQLWKAIFCLARSDTHFSDMKMTAHTKCNLPKTKAMFVYSPFNDLGAHVIGTASSIFLGNVISLLYVLLCSSKQISKFLFSVVM